MKNDTRFYRTTDRVKTLKHDMTEAEWRGDHDLAARLERLLKDALALLSEGKLLIPKF